MTGNNVSHANNKTRRVFRPNLVDVTLISDALGRSIRMRIAAASLRTVEHRGGLDAYLVKASDGDLSQRMLQVKREVVAARSSAAPSASA